MKKIIKNKEIGSILPTEESFNKWREIVYFSSGIAFTLDVVKAAYFMDIGYRAAMNTYSNYTFTEAKEQPWKSGLNAYMTFNTENQSDNWTEDMDTDVIEALINKCCIIQFGMEHPNFGDSDEYKKKFRELTEQYTKVNKYESSALPEL